MTVGDQEQQHELCLDTSDIENLHSPGVINVAEGQFFPVGPLVEDDRRALPAERLQQQERVAGGHDSSDDDDVTVIILDQTHGGLNQTASIDWIAQTGPEMEERRRNILLRELRRVQRASFLHFALLCLIPTALLLIVVATVIGEDDSCKSEATFCSLEPRTFVNAFTTRCVCDPIPVDRIQGSTP